ncbi:MAG: hypothetical protein AAFQ68_23105 [Bacteroidota bacterium]
MMIRYCLLVLFLALRATLFANIAMPGIYSGGGTGEFQLLYPEDSLAFSTIQMQREQVVAQLYPGFAVIKGTYWMNNPTQDSLRMRMGYPIDGVYESRSGMRRFEISFDDLYALEVYADGQPTMVYQEEGLQLEMAENWYLWRQSFAPDTITKIEVYFIVNTNDASVLEGYTKDRHNAFLYLLESGRTWGGMIGQGEIVIQMMEPLDMDNIWGGMPDSGFVYNPQERIMIHRFNNWEPQAGDNIGIVYGEKLENFDFAASLESSETYFASIDQLAQRDLRQLQTQDLFLQNIFKVYSFNTTGFVMGLLSFGIPLMVIFMILLVLRGLYRKISRK